MEHMQTLHTHTGLVTWPPKAVSMLKVAKKSKSPNIHQKVPPNAEHYIAMYSKYVLMSAKGELLNQTRTGLVTWPPKAYSMCKKSEVPPEAESYIAGYGKYALMSAKGELRNQNTTTLITRPPKTYSMCKKPEVPPETEGYNSHVWQIRTNVC